MTERKHMPERESCPYLPPAHKVLRAADSRALRGQPGYYLMTLACAQSLWLQGRPAQALLQLNHALAKESFADEAWPPPYQAIVWLLTRRHEEGFLGNPVRHYQHLASRVSGPNSALRSWRAWACFHLAESVLPEEEFPRDSRQIENENLTIPDRPKVLRSIGQSGSAEEAGLLRGLLPQLRPEHER